MERKSFKNKKELKKIETAKNNDLSGEERRRLDFIERCAKKQRKVAK